MQRYHDGGAIARDAATMVVLKRVTLWCCSDGGVAIRVTIALQARGATAHIATTLQARNITACVAVVLQARDATARIATVTLLYNDVKWCCTALQQWRASPLNFLFFIFLFHNFKTFRDRRAHERKEKKNEKEKKRGGWRFET